MHSATKSLLNMRTDHIQEIYSTIDHLLLHIYFFGHYWTLNHEYFKIIFLKAIYFVSSLN